MCEANNELVELELEIGKINAEYESVKNIPAYEGYANTLEKEKIPLEMKLLELKISVPDKTS